MTSYEAQAEFEVATGDGVLYVAEYRAADDRLTLYTVIGEAFEDNAEKIYLLLLRFNGTWRTNGGLRIAIDDETDAIMLEMDVPASEVVQPVRLESICSGFVGVSMEWRKVIETAAGSGIAPDTPTPSLDAMRV